MESKDLPPGDSPGPRTRSRRASLALDASKFQLLPTLDAPGGLPTPSTAPSPTPIFSTTSSGRPRAMTQVPTPQPSSPQSRQRSRAATVANPPKSSPPGAPPPEKEKRKRSRVTPEQLTHLERIFALDRSPTAAKRKEISEMLGMHERQTQIWFQNRRAKAKTLEGKGKIGLRTSPPSGADSPPDTPPDYSAPLDLDLHTLIHEEEPVTIIPCSDLSIGSWRRISATLGQHDLVAYISPSKRCLTWFILSNGYGFKMEISFDIITSTNFTSASPGQGLASFYLSRPPLFYLEAMSSPSPGHSSVKTWKKCADWTEGQQASKILRHDLVGAAIPLANALKCLPGAEHFAALSSSAPLAPTAYHHPIDPIQQPMHIPPPPMAGLEPPPPTFGLSVDTHALLHGRKRSFSGPAALSQAAPGMPDFGLLSQADASAPQPSFSSPFPTRGGTMTFTPDYSTTLFRPFSQVMPGPTASQGAHETQLSLADFSTVPISHAVAPRPYSASSVTTRFTFDSQAPPPQPGGTHAFDASATTSSPLLTAAFDPATLQQDVTMTATVMESANGSELLDPPPVQAQQHFGVDDAAAQSASHEQQTFEAVLGMEAPAHGPHMHPHAQ